MGTARKLSEAQIYSPIDCVSLDVSFLNRNTFGDVALRQEIVGLFKAQVNGTARSLALPMDAKAWLYLTHTLKGAAAAVGALEISQLAGEWGQSTAPATDLQRQAACKLLASAMAAFDAAAAKLD